MRIISNKTQLKFLALGFLVLPACNGSPGAGKENSMTGTEKPYSDSDLESKDKVKSVQTGDDTLSGSGPMAPDTSTMDPAKDIDKPTETVPTPEPKPEPKPDPVPIPAPEPEKAPMGVLPNGQYTIKGVGSRRCLEPQGKSRANGTIVIQNSCSTEAIQKWQFTFIENGYYSITNVGSSMALEVRDGIIASQTPIQQGSYTKSAHQHFVVEALKDGTYHLRARPNQNLCLDVSYASTENNAFIQLWYECHLPNEQWIILPAA